MNSLEFVNDRIRSYETMLLTAIDTKCIRKQIKHYEETLNMYKQIKAELEAWDELTTLFYITIDNFENLYISLGKETVNMLYERVPEKYINSFKKALEVEE